MKNKRGQITIFIIIGILIITAIALILFLINQKTTTPTISPEENPDEALKNCIHDDITKTIEKISYQGGDLEPKLYKKFEITKEGFSKNISYLCYTSKYYTSCTSQKPVLINHVRKEIKNNIQENLSNCFYNLVNDLEEKGYNVNSEYNGFNISFFSNKIEININAKLDYEKSEKRITKENFNIIIPSKFYELIKLAQEISSQQAKYCNFEKKGYMMFYPEIYIEDYLNGDTRIYNLEHKSSNEIFRFAIRSCAIPKGGF